MIILKSYSFLLLNLKNQEIINYVFSNAEFNVMISFDYNFDNEELVFLYINFVKSVAQRYEKFPFEIFYNSVI